MITRSRPCARNRPKSSYGVAPTFAASEADRAALAPKTASTVSPSMACAARAWVSLMFPPPMIPTRIHYTGGLRPAGPPIAVARGDPMSPLRSGGARLWRA